MFVIWINCLNIFFKKRKDLESSEEQIFWKSRWRPNISKQLFKS